MKTVIPLEEFKNYVLCVPKALCAHFHYPLISLCTQNASIFLTACALKCFLSSTLLLYFVSNVPSVVLHPRCVGPQTSFHLRLNDIFAEMVPHFLVGIAPGCLCVFFHPTDQNSPPTPIICFVLDFIEGN